VCEAAEAQSSPVILNIAEVHFKYVALEHIVPAIRAIADQSAVEMVLNLDHGMTLEGIRRAMDNGFTNIMFDGSHLVFDDNIRQTRAVVELCHHHGISVEAELGAVGGAEGGALYGEADRSKFTDVEQARTFVQETGVDFLAIAFGNVHGKYRGEPDLDFDLLRQLRDATGIPLVLHGGSGISESDFRRAISLGISKINFFTGMASVALETSRNYLNREGESYDDYPLMLEEVKTEVSRVVRQQMDIFGSSGKAGL
ncbi:MAG: ketose-bisphosphate aldolase, partial [Saprospiraceae bacterium]|nr:ketose-bisphosphate aldolase [Saprospiraceae bacterium]